MPAAELLASPRAAGIEPVELFAAHPGASYYRLSRGLSIPLVPFDLMWAHAGLAPRLGARAVTKDSLFRLLREHVRGEWSRHASRLVAAGGAFVFWLALFDFPELGVARATGERVRDDFFADPPQDGWRPATANDPWLEALFVRGFDRAPGGTR